MILFNGKSNAQFLFISLCKYFLFLPVANSLGPILHFSCIHCPLPTQWWTPQVAPIHYTTIGGEYWLILIATTHSLSATVEWDYVCCSAITLSMLKRSRFPLHSPGFFLVLFSCLPTSHIDYFVLSPHSSLPSFAPFFPTQHSTHPQTDKQLSFFFIIIIHFHTLVYTLFCQKDNTPIPTPTQLNKAWHLFFIHFLSS